MRYPEEVIEEVRQRNDIVDVISGYVQLKRQGSNYVGLCPFHSEKTPSFSVSPGKQMYYCFGCHVGGTVFNFIMEYENYTFPEAVKALADKAGVKLPEVEYTEEARKKENYKARLLEINKEAATYYYVQLRNEMGALGMRYLKGRQLSDETMHKFGLGYSLQYSDDLVRYLRKKGYDDKLIVDAGLANFNEKYGMSDKFINRVIFPIQDIQNRVIAFGGRVMGDGLPKYLNSPETEIFYKSKNLYGLNYARTSRKNEIILCEGYMDVIAMHQAGFTQAAASLGTSFTTEQAMLLKRYTKDIYLAYDSDGAGVKAALRAIGILRDASMSGKVINMEPYKDPDEFIKNLGVEEFQKRIDNAENSFFFEIRILQRGFRMDNPEERTSFQREIAKKLCLFEEEMERENYLTAVAETYQINPQSLRKMVVSTAAKMGGIKTPAPIRSGIQKKETEEDGVKKSQRILLTWLAEEPGLFRKIEEYITPEDFTDELYQQVARQLFENHNAGNDNPAMILNSFESGEEQHQVAEIFNTPLEMIETKEDREKAFRDIIYKVKSNSYAYYSSRRGTDDNALRQALDGKRVLEKLKKIHFVLD